MRWLVGWVLHSDEVGSPSLPTSKVCTTLEWNASLAPSLCLLDRGTFEELRVLASLSLDKLDDLTSLLKPAPRREWDGESRLGHQRNERSSHDQPVLPETWAGLSAAINWIHQ